MMQHEKLGDVGSVRNDRLSEYSFNIWKQEVDLTLTYGEVDDAVVQANPNENGTLEYTSWGQGDKHA